MKKSKSKWYFDGFHVVVEHNKKTVLMLKPETVRLAKQYKNYNIKSESGKYILMKQKKNEQWWYVNGECVVVFSENDVEKICNTKGGYDGKTGSQSKRK